MTDADEWEATSRARELILELVRDPDVCVHAMHSLRRAFGNEEARRRVEPLLEDENDRVHAVARDTLKKIDRVLAR
jgi:HEAT repeat protein